MLLWPAVALLGFVALAAVVIALGRDSTLRYESERELMADQRRPVTAVVGGPAVGASGGGPRSSATGGAPAPGALPEHRTTSTAAHPAGTRTAERVSASAWWLVDDGGAVLPDAGPFADRIEADWAAMAGGLPTGTRPVYGVRGGDGALLHRQAPQERAWLHELGGHLDRLPPAWDDVLSDDDPLTTLVVEVAAALLEAGLPLHDGSDCADPSGGVCLTPDVGSVGVLVSWRQHDRMGVQQVRGASAAAALQRTMDTAVASVLSQLGFEVAPLGVRGGHRVTAAPLHLT